MRKLPALILALFLTPALASADVRTVAGLSGFQVDLASAGNISAVLTLDSGSNTLHIQVSDGRGLTWSSPQAVSNPGATPKVKFEELAIVGDKIFTAWADDRFEVAGQGSPATTTPFVRAYDTTSGTFGPEIQVPTGTNVGDTGGSNFGFVAVEVAGATHLHIASQRRLFDPATGVTTRAIVLYSSHDAGATWAAPLVIDSATSNAFTSVGVVADANHVHVLYGKYTAAFDAVLMDQRSLDGGLTSSFPTPNPVPGAGFMSNFQAALDGGLLAIVYENLSGSFSEAWAVTSTNGGASYNAPTPFNTPLGVPSFNNSFEPRVTIAKGTGEVTAITMGWDSSNFYMLSMIHSSDGGQTWPDSSTPFQTGSKNINELSIVADGSGRDRVVATWRAGGKGANFLYGSNSFDGGASFEAPFLLTTLKTVHVRLAWNDLYQNAISSFSEWILPVGPVPSIGGWRPQSITPTGFTSGSTSIGNSFSDFDGGADLAYLLLSTEAMLNPVVLADGRNIGLGISGLFASSIQLALGGPFSAMLSPTGDGVMSTIPLVGPGVPPGLTLHAVGISFEIASASLVDISDVVRFDT